MERKPRSKTNYWISYSDLIAGLLFIFLIIIAIQNRDFQKQNKDYKDIHSEVKAFLKIKENIGKELKSKIKHKDVIIDKVGIVTITGEGYLFHYKEAILRKEGKSLLKEVMPKYLDVLFDNKITEGQIDKIHIIGHASKEYEGLSQYLVNLDLSQRRAYSVAEYILEENKDKFRMLKTHLVSLGRSSAEAKSMDKPEDRKVVIKYSLKSEEMLDKIQRKMEKATK